MINWIVTQLRPQAPAFWLLLSAITGLLLPLLWSQLSASVRHNLSLARWVLIPYLGLLAGGLSPRLFGLSNPDWAKTLGLGLVLVVTLLTLLILVRMSTLAPQATRAPADPPPTPSLIITPYLTQLLWSGAEEFHWSFLRAAVWELLLRFPTPPTFPLYTALWIAALLAALEIVIRQRAVAFCLRKLVVLTASTSIFLYTQNFWLCWFLHAGAWLLLAPRLAPPTVRLAAKK